VSGEGPLTHLREHEELIEADLRLIRRYLPAPSRVLDIGAGRGSFVLRARRDGLDAVGLEMEPGAVRVWSKLAVPGVVADGFRTPFVDAAFAVVRMKEVIEHVEDPLALVREARRVLAPGGLFIAHIPTPYSQFYPVGNFWDDYTHVRPLSRTGIQRLLADAGMRVLTIDAYTAGRNAVERALGRVLARVLPHIYRVTATLEDD
jgi:SAM-dependent methyltransferase